MNHRILNLGAGTQSSVVAEWPRNATVAQKAAVVFRGMPAEEYHSLPGASASRLAKLIRSPAHCRYEMDNPKPPTPAMVLGTALHTAVLENHKFASQFAIAGPCEAIKKDGTPCTNGGIILVGGRWYCGVRGHAPMGMPDMNMIVLSTEDADAGVKMAFNIGRHPAAWKLLQAKTDVELSVFWADKETGVNCKARFDAVCGGLGILLDLKTTRNSSPEDFPDTIFEYGYHRQLAHYLDGAAANGLVLDAAAIIAVENDAPHAVAVYRMPDDALDIGRDELRKLLAIWKRCEDSGEWPAYPDDVIENFPIPRWVVRES